MSFLGIRSLIKPMSGCVKRRDLAATPSLIVLMSLQLAIPRRVALQQGSPPLHQPGAILNERAFAGQSILSKR